jgi:hypothetical protein
VDYGDGLENRFPIISGRGFESHSLRQLEFVANFLPLVRLNRDLIQHSDAHRIQFVPLDIGLDQNIIPPER